MSYEGAARVRARGLVRQLACDEDGDCQVPAVLTCPSCSLNVRVVADESDVDDC